MQLLRLGDRIDDALGRYNVFAKNSFPRHLALDGMKVVVDAANGAGYRADGFARYLSGILYEAAGDLNNAFIAYRNAYEAYDAMRGWAHTPPPAALPDDDFKAAIAAGGCRYLLLLRIFSPSYPEPFYPAARMKDSLDVVASAAHASLPDQPAALLARRLPPP